MPPAHCVIVEDQKMFAELLATLLRATPDIELEIVETVPNMAAGIAACERHRPDLLLLDLSLPDGPGLAVAERLHAVHPQGKAIIVTGQAASFVCPKSLSDVVVAVIDKSDAFGKLQAAINLFASERQRRPAEFSGNRPLPQRIPLSARERQVLLLIGRGKTSKCIAEELGISVHTVHVHRKRMAAKLGARGNELRLQAYRYCQQLEDLSSIRPRSR